jgi:hypothetical protein
MQSDDMKQPLTIRTSESGWLAHLTKAYTEKTEVEIVDDANVGIDPANQTLVQMGIKGKLSRKQWIAASIAAGMTVFGAVVIVLAVLDPDPTSKLGLLIASGAVLTLSGGFSAIGILIRQKPPTIEMSRNGIFIRWD